MQVRRGSTSILLVHSFIDGARCTNRYTPNRFLALFQLRNFGTNVLPAVPAILESTTDPRGVPFDFSPVLHDIGLEPTTSVQVLIIALRAEKPLIRASAANSLGTLGTNAAVAGPALQALLLDGNQLVREQSTNALLKIAPELVTNNQGTGHPGRR